MNLLFRYVDSDSTISMQIKLEEETGELARHSKSSSDASIQVEVDLGEPAVCADILAIKERTGLDFVLVPGGEFVLGADGADVTALGIDDISVLPRQRVSLPSFWISKHPVTNDQYARFLRDQEAGQFPKYWSNERFNQGLQPVVGVSWLDAGAYANWAGLMLPSEAQWEAAARGKEGWTYPWGNDAPDSSRASFGGRRDRPSRIGSYPEGAGPYGTLDQAGNVWEWCQDTFNRDGKTESHGRFSGRFEASELVSPGSIRVRRGGSWLLPEHYLFSGFRSGIRSDTRAANLGFRVACLAEN